MKWCFRAAQKQTPTALANEKEAAQSRSEKQIAANSRNYGELSFTSYTLFCMSACMCVRVYVPVCHVIFKWYEGQIKDYKIQMQNICIY